MTLLVGKEQKMFHGQVESGFDWVLKEAEGAHTRFHTPLREGRPLTASTQHGNIGGFTQLNGVVDIREPGNSDFAVTGVHSSNPISMQKSTSEEGVEITSYSLGDKFFKLTENHQNGAILLQEWNT